MITQTEVSETVESKHQDLMTKAYTKWAKGLNYREFLYKLDVAERRAVVIGNLNYQVENGGFAQWVDNKYSDGIEFLREALTAVGTDTAKKVRDMAYQAFNLCEEESRYNRYDSEDNDEDYRSPLDELDTRYYELSDQLIVDVEKFFSETA